MNNIVNIVNLLCLRCCVTSTIEESQKSTPLLVTRMNDFALPAASFLEGSFIGSFGLWGNAGEMSPLTVVPVIERRMGCHTVLSRGQ